MVDETEPAASNPGAERPPRGRTSRRRSGPKVKRGTGPDPDRGAGAVGVGGGTLVAVLTSILPEGPLKTVLIWLAPFVTVTFSAVWIECRRRLQEYLAIKEAETAFRDAKKAIDVALQDPNLTPEQRFAFEQKRIEVDQMLVDLMFSRAIKHIQK